MAKKTIPAKRKKSSPAKTVAKKQPTAAHEIGALLLVVPALLQRVARGLERVCESLPVRAQDVDGLIVCRSRDEEPSAWIRDDA